MRLRGSVLFLVIVFFTSWNLSVHADKPVDTAENGIIDNVYELEALFIDHQYTFLPIGPPSEDVFFQPYDMALPVAWKKFPTQFLKGLVGRVSQDSIPLYDLSVFEDPLTRAVVFVNAFGTEIYRLKPEPGYDPYYWQRWWFKLKEGETLSGINKWIYDPAHQAAEFILVPAEFYDAYLVAQAEQALAESMMPMMMGMSLPETVTNLMVGIERSTGGTVEVEVAWPETFTSDLDIFACTDLIGRDWALIASNLVTAGSSSLIWPDVATTNILCRFYVAGNADLDTDGDGLVDAREKYLHGTDYNLKDTDGDGLWDGWEFGYGFNPLSTVGTNGALGDADGDGYGNLEEQRNNTDSGSVNDNSTTGTVATIRYYYDEDDRMTDFYSSTEVAQKTILTPSHNISEDVSAK